MDTRYGIVLDGLLLETFDTPMDAYDAAICAYEESRLFYEVIWVSKVARGIND